MRTILCTLLALVTVLAGCTGPTMPAFGETDDLVIIMDQAAGSELRGELAAVFEAPDPWLVGESAFDVVFATPDQLSDHTNWRNLLFCGTWNGGRVGEVVRDRIPGVPLTDAATFATTTDVWAGRQVVATLMADSEERLVALLRVQGASVRDRLITDVRARLVTALRRDAASSGFGAALEDRFGWSISVPEDYELDTGAERDGFIRFDRRRPDRYVFVSWRPGAAGEVTREYALAERDRICSLYHDGDTVQERRPALADTVLLGGLPALRLRGWWGNTELGGGGPFVSYCLYAPDDARIYYIDASLFAPGIDKAPLMRHLDGVLMTFRP